MLTCNADQRRVRNRAKGLASARAGGLIGTRQHGDDSASLITSTMDAKLLEQASNAAREILNQGGEESARLIELASERYGTMLGDIAMN